MSGEKCQTCGPNSVEQHPRQPAVTRCANCKEWLTAPAPEPSEVAETTAGERECLAGPACPRVQHADACRPVCGFAADASGVAVLTETEREALFTRTRELSVSRDTAILETVVGRIVAAHVSAAETKARADERERIARAIEAEDANDAYGNACIAHAALIARGDAR